MFQKELGEKILGEYSTSHYGRLSILTNYRLKILNKFLISSNCFYPKPKITSMIISFFPIRNVFFKIKKIENLEYISNVFFSKKRKMINKTIKDILSKEKINEIKNLRLSSRPSDLKPEIYYKITQLYEKK